MPYVQSNQPSRRVYIPKADGRQRPLGIAALEDKIVQQAVVTILNQIYTLASRGDTTAPCGVPTLLSDHWLDGYAVYQDPASLAYPNRGNLRIADYTSREMALGAFVPKTIRVVLFDVGGVLVEPSGVATMLGWMHNSVSAEQLWRMWLTSSSVRAFETGRLSPEAFADQVIAEFGLPVSTEVFLQEMTRWSVTLFPGAIELVEQIRPPYVRATLCNTNVIHWKYLMGNKRLARAFPYHFASHLIGKIKPDAEAFQHVTDALQCEAHEVIFLDDNDMNVVSARSLGMQAVRVRGIAEAKQALLASGVLEI